MNLWRFFIWCNNRFITTKGVSIDPLISQRSTNWSCLLLEAVGWPNKRAFATNVAEELQLIVLLNPSNSCLFLQPHICINKIIWWSVVRSGLSIRPDLSEAQSSCLSDLVVILKHLGLTKLHILIIDTVLFLCDIFILFELEGQSTLDLLLTDYRVWQPVTVCWTLFFSLANLCRSGARLVLLAQFECQYCAIDLSSVLTWYAGESMPARICFRLRG